MKILIWLLSALIYSLIMLLFKANGILLGAIPVFLLFGGATWIARTLCSKWDERKNRGQNDDEA